MNRLVMVALLASCSTAALADGQIVHYVTSKATANCHSLSRSNEGVVVFVDYSHAPAGLSTQGTAPGAWAVTDDIMFGGFDEQLWEWLVTQPTGPWETGGAVCSAVMLGGTMHLHCPRDC